MQSNNEKTLGVEAGKQIHNEGTDRSSVQYQEERITMLSIVGDAPKKFDTTINVAGATVSTGVFAGGGFPSVTLEAGPRVRHFTPAEALALAAALQATSVHLMEQDEVAA